MCSPRWSTTCVAYSASGHVTFLGPLSTPFPSVRQPGYLLKKRRPVALRPRLTTGLPLSQRAPLPLEEMHPHMYRLTQRWVVGQGLLRPGFALRDARVLPLPLFSGMCRRGVLGNLVSGSKVFPPTEGQEEGPESYI